MIPAVRQLVGGTGAVVHLLAVRPLPRPSAPDALWWANPESMIAATLMNAPAGTPARAEPYDQVLRHEHATLDRYLLRHGSQLAYDGIVVRRQVRFGDPLQETLAVARREAIHLILVAPQAQHWWDRLRPAEPDAATARPVAGPGAGGGGRGGAPGGGAPCAMRARRCSMPVPALARGR